MRGDALNPETDWLYTGGSRQGRSSELTVDECPYRVGKMLGDPLN